MVSCMKQWLHKEEIQDMALWCIHRLASSDAVIAVGGVQVIVSSMKLFPSTPDIRRGGCLALASVLTSPDSSAAKNIASLLIKDWEGVSMVMDAMTKWPKDSAMQAAAIRLLCHLSIVKEARLQMMNKDAVNLVGKASNNFPTDESIKAHAMTFMKTMLKTMIFSQKGKGAAQAVGRKSRRQSRTRRQTISFAPSPFVPKGLEAMHASAPDLSWGSDKNGNQEDPAQSSLAKRRVSSSPSLADDSGWNHKGKAEIKLSNPGPRNHVSHLPDLEETSGSDWTHYEDQTELSWPDLPNECSC